MSRPLDQVILNSAQAGELRGLLEALTQHHELMLELLAAHRSAISRADAGAIEACITRQQEAAIRLSDLEGRRSALVRSIWLGGQGAATATTVRGRAPAAPGPMPAITLSFLASRAEEPIRSALLGAATRLKELMKAVSQRQRAVLSASESLLGHMQGLIAQVARGLSQTGTYARPGSAAPPPMAAALDMTS